MVRLCRWVLGARKRLTHGLLSRAEYERSLDLCLWLAAELKNVAPGVAEDAIARSMRKAIGNDSTVNRRG